MSLELFKVTEINPNDDVGGGGCLCSPEQATSYCKPPYVVFYAACTDESYSPHVVVCQRCIEAASEAMSYDHPDPLEVVDGEAEEDDGEAINL